LATTFSDQVIATAGTEGAYGFPLRQTASMITASLRANAVRAFLGPDRRCSASAQSRSGDGFLQREINELAASTSIVRT